jgi:alpha-L-rhamnosidase
MVAWIDYAARMARERRHSNRRASRPSPEPHEAFIWDTGFHWGEWLEPGQEHVDPEDLAAADHGEIATAYLHHSASLLVEIAEVLGREEEAVRYRELAAATKTAWQREFIGQDGSLRTNTQASHVRALAFDLVAEDLRPSLTKRLVALIRAADTHVGTGFLATPYLLPVLADNGYVDVAYELLFRDTEPSWLAMIDRGATTIWEHWRALDEHGIPSAPPGVGSLNHYSKGAVISFLHRYVAGIRLGDEPGYRRFVIAPLPGGGLHWARAHHDSPYGRIESAWKIDADSLVLDVRVPAGATAEVRMPDGQRFTAHPGATTYRCALQKKATT